MTFDTTSRTRWDQLHREQRHGLRYPSEHVVRFLSSVPRGGKAIDIGCGRGRHLRLLREMGFAEFGVDSSDVVDQVAGAQYGLMTALPFADETFDVALAYGVFYYGTRDDMDAAIHEMWRVLKPGAKGFAVLRTTADWRFEHTTDGIFRCESEPEDGLPIVFVGESDVRFDFCRFSSMAVDWTETSSGARLNSDWLITVTK